MGAKGIGAIPYGPTTVENSGHFDTFYGVSGNKFQTIDFDGFSPLFLLQFSFKNIFFCINMLNPEFSKLSQ